MTKLGYMLSSEEHGPGALARHARRAEETGFDFALISDHYHPWTTTQGQSPFVWGTLGAIAETTERIRIGTGVTCPTIRIHPAIIAQAAATAAVQMPERFFLGVGSGENLNEHVTGHRWPPIEERLARLEEAILIIRMLWEGGERSYSGRHYELEDARIFTLPDEPPPIYVASTGERSAELAAQLGDGLISTVADPSIVEAHERRGAAPGSPRIGLVHVCWAESDADARRTVRDVWPNAALSGRLNTELRVPGDIEAAVADTSDGALFEQVAVGPDPEDHIQAIERYVEAGFDHVCIHQIGQDQEGLFRLFERSIRPRVASAFAH